MLRFAASDWFGLALPTNQEVGSSNLSGRAVFLGSFPVTSLTIYTGDIADTLALKGLGAHSTRVHWPSKKPRS